MPQYTIPVNGVVNNAVCVYTYEAASEEAAIRMYLEGAPEIETVIIGGDFEADPGEEENLEAELAKPDPQQKENKERT